MKTVLPAKPAHRCQSIIILEIVTPREGNLRLGVSDNQHATGVGCPPLFKTCIAFTANISRFKFYWWARSRRIWVDSQPWSSTHEPKGRRLPTSRTAKCSKERCQSWVPSMEIPTKTWLPCVTGGLCCHVHAAHWWLSGNVKLGLFSGSVVHCDVFVLVCCAFCMLGNVHLMVLEVLDTHLVKFQRGWHFFWRRLS